MDVWTVLEWVGRVVFVAFFIMSGIMHLVNRKAIAGYAWSKGLPAPVPATIVSGLMLLCGGILILVRWHATAGAAAIFVFLVTAAFTIHNFWAVKDPMAKAGEQAQFWKNITLAAALVLYVVAHHRGAL